MPQPDGCGMKSPERQRVMHKNHTEKMFILSYTQPC